MTSIREIIHKQFISVRQEAETFQLPSPISLRTLIAPEQVILQPGRELSAGDVSGWVQFALLSNGWWSYRGHLHDSGDLYGDKYSCVFALTFVDQSGVGIYINQEGTIGHGDHADWEHWGVQPWISRNWEQLKTTGFGFRCHLHTDPDLSWLKDLVYTLFTVGIFLLPMTTDKCSWQRDPDGNPVVICEW